MGYLGMLGNTLIYLIICIWQGSCFFEGVLKPFFFLAFLRKSTAGAVCVCTACPPNVKAPVVKSAVLNSLDLIRKVECFEENRV